MHSVFNTFFCCDDEYDEDGVVSSLSPDLHDVQEDNQENIDNQSEPAATEATKQNYESDPSAIKNRDASSERLQHAAPSIDSSSSSSAKDIAQELWDNGGKRSVLPSLCGREGVAEWLGKNDPFRANVLKHYMGHFDFANKRLDDAFRMVCNKFYFKAEAQQIDRILQVFALRYWECNPTHVLRSSDIVYAVAYSMLLLNTDLHVAQEKNRHKMTRSKFIQNTMATIHDLAFPLLRANTPCFQERESRSLLPSSESVVSGMSISSTAAPPSSPKWIILRRSMSLAGPNDIRYNNSRHSLWIPKVSGSGIRSKDMNQWFSQVEALLKDIYDAIKAEKFSKAGDDEGNIGEEQQKRRKRRGRSLLYIRDAPNSHDKDSQHQMDDDNTDGAFTSPLPVTDASPKSIREGLLMKKHVMGANNRKPRQRDWQLCYLSARDGTLSIYQPTGLIADCDKRVCGATSQDRRRGSLSILLPGQIHENRRLDLELHKTTSNMLHQTYHLRHPLPSRVLHRIDLKHALATALPSPTTSAGDHHVFCLQTADGGVWLFEAADHSSVLEWVSICNYWGARLSKEPLSGAVGSLDYGWGGSFPSSDQSLVKPEESVSAGAVTATTPLPEWKPPLPCVVPSTLSEKEQLQALEKRVLAIDKDLDLHREGRRHIYARFSGSPSQIQRALDNWERKAQYMIQELIKTRTYCDTLAQFIGPP
ncbi:hypothetical protein BX666DRAFT_2028603 [Dichotomocladium elegans]|nr:hypothetical protein BX666DRAFT_2028603 [Dichotomocladium elegans]